jgi:hypothetical protein
MPNLDERLVNLENIIKTKTKVIVVRFQTDEPNNINFNGEVITNDEYELRKLDERYNVIDIYYGVKS